MTSPVLSIYFASSTHHVDRTSILCLLLKMEICRAIIHVLIISPVTWYNIFEENILQMAIKMLLNDYLI